VLISQIRETFKNIQTDPIEGRWKRTEGIYGFEKSPSQQDSEY
jgi:hypothetical protein